MTTDPNKQLANAFKAMAVLLAFFAAIAFFTSCSKTEVIEKNIVQTMDNPVDLMFFTGRMNMNKPKYSRTYRYHANMSSPKDSLFYYTSFIAYTDSTPPRFKWVPVITHEIGNDPINVIISRKPPKDGEEPQ